MIGNEAVGVSFLPSVIFHYIFFVYLFFAVQYFYTALMFASGGHGYPAIVKLLLGAGANVDARSGKVDLYLCFCHSYPA